jgi:hypothetical protein
VVDPDSKTLFSIRCSEGGRWTPPNWEVACYSAKSLSSAWKHFALPNLQRCADRLEDAISCNRMIIVATFSVCGRISVVDRYPGDVIIELAAIARIQALANVYARERATYGRNNLLLVTPDHRLPIRTPRQQSH